MRTTMGRRRVGVKPARRAGLAGPYGAKVKVRSALSRLYVRLASKPGPPMPSRVNTVLTKSA
jgi:hypothetical protein